MHIKDVLQEIVKSIPTSNIPTDFVSMVKLKDHEGNRRIIKGADLEDFFRSPEAYDSIETRLVVNVERINRSILKEVENVFDEVDRMQASRFE